MAIKCDNCDRPAVYTTADPGVSPAHYCSACLPYWLQDRANSGHFPLMEAFDQTPKETPVVEEPAAVEEPAEETPVEEAPKPKKKAAPKATADEDNQ